MTTYTQLVAPRLWVTDEAGYCHRMAQKVYGAPWVAGLNSATAAANVTKFKHRTRKMPDVSVPVWFDHWGTYGGVYANWGHVVSWVPGRGFLSSPWYSTFGQEWYSTVEGVERTFNAKFRFWSEDINTLRVVSPSPVTPPKPKPKPTPEPELELGEIMAFKSIGIGYRPNDKEDRLVSIGLDYETGQVLSETILTKSYGTSFYKATTEGGFVIVSKGHYEKLVAEFPQVVESKRAHEIAVAAASVGGN